jgi:hypothetical protein
MKKSIKKKKIAPKPAKAFKKIVSRNTPVPKAAAAIPAPRKEITHEMVAKRAYEIFLSGHGGDEMHNWLTAEHELRGQ